jgi:hypothetical protein
VVLRTAVLERHGTQGDESVGSVESAEPVVRAAPVVPAVPAVSVAPVVPVASPDLPGPIENVFLQLGWFIVERIVAVILFFTKGELH